MIENLAILLTVFNRKEKTLKCLQRVYAQLPMEGYNVNVYLTNDGCTDGTPEAVLKKFPKVHIINGKGDLFWNREMYTAWNEASKTKKFKNKHYISYLLFNKISSNG